VALPDLRHDGHCVLGGWTETQPALSVTLSVTMLDNSGFSGLVVSMLAAGTQDCGFEPGRTRRIFRAKKSTAGLPAEGK
jgi:hypothetical protein